MKRKDYKRLLPKAKEFEKLRVKKCRICGSTDLYEFLSLGSMPVPNGFLTDKEIEKKEVRYPLGVYLCQSCGLVQLTHVVPPEVMFKNYLYIPSTSTTMLKHFENLAEYIIRKFKLSPKDLVIDIGSNDGTLLSFFRENEIQVLGIDPASNLVKISQLKGIETINDFFTTDLAKTICEKKGRVKIITATNVVAHLDDLHGLCEGVKSLLNEKGVFIVEFPYLVDLLNNNEFDTIYHEHLSYFAIRPLIDLFKQHEMYIFDIERLSIHGGSVRLYIAKNGAGYQQSKMFKNILKKEFLEKLDTRYPYDNFAKRVKIIKRDLVKLLRKLCSQGKIIAGYGAAAKGNVLLNYCGIKRNLIPYIVDSIPFKQGRYTPGTHIPIYPEKRLGENFPDYVLILAWNFADEIMKKQARYKEAGGHFIITIPRPRIE